MGRATRFSLATAFVALTLLTPASSGALSTARVADRSWQWQNGQPQGNTLNALSFPSTTVGYAAGRSGAVLRTTDGGATWSALDTGNARDHFGAAFPVDTLGWVVGESGAIVRTADSGATWTQQPSSTAATLRDVAALDTMNAIAVGDAPGGATIRYTGTSGASWSAGITTVTAGLNAVAYPSSTLAWAVGANGTMIRSLDGGASWVATSAPTGAALNDVAFSPGTTVGYAVGNNTGTTWNAFKTTDGTSWVRLELPGTAVPLVSVSCAGVNGSAVTVVGANGTVLRSTNGGATWTVRSPARLAAVTLRAAEMPSATQVHVAGDFGVTLRSRDAGANWLSPLQQTPANLTSAVFTSPTSGWAVGTGGLVMRTGDGGASWTGRSLGAFTLRGIHSLNLSSVWVVGDGGVIRYTTNGGTTWTTQSTGLAANPRLNDVFFTSNNKGTIVGNAGTILETSNSGSNWSKRDAGTTQPLNAIIYANNTRGWTVGGGGVIRATTTGGANWNNPQVSGTTRALYDVWAADTQNVWAVGELGTVLRTTNGGTTWNTIPTAAVGTTETLRAVGGSSPLRVWVAGASGTVRLTTDGGATWTTLNAGLPSTAADIPSTVAKLRVSDTNNATLIADRGQVRTTTDGGTTWAPSYYGTFQALEDVSSDGADGAWAVGANGTVLNTFDGGASWYRQVPGTSSNLNGVAFPTASAGWVVGENGVIRATTSGGWIWTTQTSGTTARLADVDAGSASNAIAVGSGVVRHTANGGTSWSAGAGLGGRQLNRVSMASASSAWAVATSGSGTTVIRTTDGGANWSSAATMTASLYGVHFRPSSTTGWVVGANGAIHKTTDGTTWVTQPSGTTVTLRAVSFSSASRGRITGDDGVSLLTTDGGSTWTLQDTGTTSKSLRGVAIISGVEAFAVGSEGAVLRAYDLTQPTTTLLVSPPAPDGDEDPSGDFTWYVSQPIAQLVPSAGATAYYAWNTTASPAPYMTPLVATEGTSTLFYRSQDASDQIEPWRSITFNVDVTAPTSPTAPAASLVSSSSATISWSASTDAISGVARYQVFVNGVVAGTTDELSRVVTGLMPNETYSVTVRAVDNAGNVSAPSSAVTFTTLDAADAPLGTVMTLSPATPDGLNGWYVTTPTVTLESVPATFPTTDRDIRYGFDVDELTYPLPQLYAGPFAAPAGAYTISYASSPTVETLRVPVRRYDESLTVDPQPMPAPSGLVTTQTVGYGLRLTWNAVPDDVTPSGLDGYELYRDGVLVDTVPRNGSPTRDYEFTGLDPSTTYVLGVRSFNVAGTRSALSTISATSAAVPAPDAPRVVYARGTDGDSVYLNWEPITEAFGTVRYLVERSVDGAPYSRIATVTGQAEMSFVDTGLRSSTAYSYRLQAVDDRPDASAYTTPVATLTRAPYRVGGVTATGTAGAAIVSWTPPANPAVAGYYVYRSFRSLAATPTTLTVIPTTATTFIDPLLPAGSYWYRVAAVDESAAVGVASVEIRVDVEPAAPASSLSPHGDDEMGDQCAACHRGHTAFGRNLSVFSDESAVTTAQASQATCLGCHNGFIASDVKSPLLSPFTTSRHDIAIDVFPGTQYCSSCHSSHRSDEETDPALLDVDGVRAGTEVCYQCHGPSVAPLDFSVFEGSSHAGVSHDSAIGAQCSACHDTHASANEQLLTYSGWMICMQCHGGRQDATTPDILTLISAGGDNRNRHDITLEDQLATGARITCQNCHNTHAVTEQYPLVDPDDPSLTGTWTQGINAFCFRCHDGLLPNAGQTRPWVAAPLSAGGETTTTNIASAYQTNVHGFGESTSTALFLRPEMGYSIGDVLTCDTCHHGHGTVNPRNLRQDIVSADGSLIVNGLLVADVPGGGLDTRFFCGACHDISPARHLTATGGATSIDAFPMDCTACHSHTTMGSVTTTDTGTIF